MDDRNDRLLFNSQCRARHLANKNPMNNCAPLYQFTVYEGSFCDYGGNGELDKEISSVRSAGSDPAAAAKKKEQYGNKWLSHNIAKNSWQ